MYFIQRGLVQVTMFVPPRFRETPVRQLSDGAHFGEIALLRADRRRTASVSWPLVARFVRSSLAAMVSAGALRGDGVQAVGSGCSG